MNKKAIMMGIEGLVKIVLALLVIIVLAGLAWVMLNSTIDNTKEQQAESNIEIAYSKIKAVAENEIDKTDFKIEAPNGWEMQAWPNKNTIEKPEQCREESCICLCPSPSYFPSGKAWERSLKQCNTNGKCKDFSKEIKTIDKYDYENPLIIKKGNSFDVFIENDIIVIQEKEEEIDS